MGKSELKPWINLLRMSIGIIYIWFGALKFFHGVSPAENLAKDTIHYLSFGLIAPETSLFLLALWETLIGLVLITGYYLRTSIIILLVHMACTFTPLVFFPKLSFSETPYALTLVGQYILKNIIIVSALAVIYKFDQLRKT